MRTIFVLIALASIAAAQSLPNPKLTPGKVRTTSVREICSPKFRTAKYRKTTLAQKKAVCHSYGVKNCPRYGAMELDHLVPLELGGADDTRNIFVQMAPWYHEKDKLENFLHAAVCSGTMSLPAAQQCIAKNWIACKQRLMDRGEEHGHGHRAD
jgi:hypothetical protein